MTFLVPLMMWGWIPFNIILFKKFTPQKAILISVIGGVLFLPVTSYDLPVINYDKNTAIAISLLFGIIFSEKIKELAFKPKKLDIPIISWCIISPFFSLLTNDYEFRHIIFAVINTSILWGVFYLLGRTYFCDKGTLRQLSRAIIIGGLIYTPLVLFEIRMSPQLSTLFYGFCPHDWFQLVRYGGFRSIVFMNHGLMVALWLAAAYIVSFWFFKTREITKIKNFPMVLIIFLLLITTVFMKCSAAIVYLLLGTIGYYYYKKLNSKKIFTIYILAIIIYIFLRISSILSAETILDYLSTIFNAERIESLSTRLFQEEVFSRRALERPLFGWGAMDRAWPVNPFTGENVISMIDSLYLAVFSIRGYFGLLSLYAVFLLGPWKIMKSRIESIDAVVLSLVLIFYSIDTLLNGFINPVFILIAGALISVSERLSYDETPESWDV